MRKRLVPSLGALVILLGAAPASAGILTSASWITQINTAPAGGVVSFTVPITATGTSTSTSVALSLTVPAFSQSVQVLTDPITIYATLSLSGSQMFSAGISTLNAKATQGVAGNQFSKLAKAPPTTLIKVPLNVGVKGMITDYSTVLGVTAYITVDHYGWRTHTDSFTGLTWKGAGLPSVVAMGSFNVTANGGGTVTLVSPSKITVQSSLTSRKTVSLTTLKLTFVPEPGTLLLLGAAGLGLLMLQRS
jgi:PEP-CTERM motif